MPVPFDSYARHDAINRHKATWTKPLARRPTSSGVIR